MKNKNQVDISHKRAMSQKESKLLIAMYLLIGITISSIFIIASNNHSISTLGIIILVIGAISSFILYFKKAKAIDSAKKEDKYVSIEDCESIKSLMMGLIIVSIFVGIIFLVSSLFAITWICIVALIDFALIHGQFEEQRKYIVRQKAITSQKKNVYNLNFTKVEDVVNFVSSTLNKGNYIRNKIDIYNSKQEISLSELIVKLALFDKYTECEYKFNFDLGFIFIKSNILFIQQVDNEGNAKYYQWFIEESSLSDLPNLDGDIRVSCSVDNEEIIIPKGIFDRFKTEYKKIKEDLWKDTYFECRKEPDYNALLIKYFGFDITNLNKERQRDILKTNIKLLSYDAITNTIKDKIDGFINDDNTKKEQFIELGKLISERKYLIKHKKVLDNFVNMLDNDIWLSHYKLKEFQKFIEKKYLLNEKVDTEIIKEFASLTEIVEDFRELIFNAEELEINKENNMLLYTLVKTFIVNKYSKIAKKEFEISDSSNYLEEYINNPTILQDDRKNLMLLSYYMAKEGLSDRGILYTYDKLQVVIKDEVKKAKKQAIQDKLLGKTPLHNHRISIDDVDIMSGGEFEVFIGELFKSLGYKSSVTKLSGDQGVDVVLEKSGLKTGIQCKRYSGKISNKAVQEAVAGKAYYKLDKVMVITNSYFTQSAYTLAEANDVILWDRDTLIEKIKKYKG